MTMMAMLEWLRFLRSLSEARDGRYIHLILDDCATDRCDDVLALAD
jgi:hypothetical protein